jgi:site-specific DNA-methyltransferase (adenine-specific)
MYCALTEKRLAIADSDPSIQGYVDGVFWERNMSQNHAGVSIPSRAQRRLPILDMMAEEEHS